MRSIRSAGAAVVRAGRATVSRAVEAAKTELFWLKYAGKYDKFVSDRARGGQPKPDAFGGIEHREVQDAVHNLSIIYGVKFPKDIRTNEEKYYWLQGFALGCGNEATREHIVNSLSGALKRDYEVQERSLGPIELLEGLKNHYGRA
jgi:hypothetical protein